MTATKEALWRTLIALKEARDLLDRQVRGTADPLHEKVVGWDRVIRDAEAALNRATRLGV
jgi:hypothetical protein